MAEGVLLNVLWIGFSSSPLGTKVIVEQPRLHRARAALQTASWLISYFSNSVRSWFVKISLRCRHFLMVKDGAFSHKSTMLHYLGDSKSQRAFKLHYWFKSYGGFAEWVDLAYWWSCMGKGLSLQPAQQACLKRSCHRLMSVALTWWKPVTRTLILPWCRGHTDDRMDTFITDQGWDNTA